MYINIFLRSYRFIRGRSPAGGQHWQVRGLLRWSKIKALSMPEAAQKDGLGVEACANPATVQESKLELLRLAGPFSWPVAVRFLRRCCSGWFGVCGFLAFFCSFPSGLAPAAGDSGLGKPLAGCNDFSQTCFSLHPCTSLAQRRLYAIQAKLIPLLCLSFYVVYKRFVNQSC